MREREESSDREWKAREEETEAVIVRETAKGEM